MLTLACNITNNATAVLLSSLVTNNSAFSETKANKETKAKFME